MKRSVSTILKNTAIVGMSAVLAIGAVGCGSSGNNADVSTADEAVSDDVAMMDDTLALAGDAGKKVDTYSGYLGYGYDILSGGFYASDDVNLDSCVLDMDSLAAAGYVRVDEASQRWTSYYCGESYRDILVSLAQYTEGVSALSLPVAFAGVADGTYSDSLASAWEDTFYLYASSNVQTQREFISTKSAKRLSQYLKEDFVDAVDEMSAEEILEEYGPYVMTDISVGGSFDFEAMIKDTGEYTSDQVMAYVQSIIAAQSDDEESVQAAADTLEGIDIEAMQASFDSNSLIFADVNGGTVSIKPSSINGTLNKFGKWADSVADKPTFSYAYNGIAIWKLIEQIDSDKAKEVYNAFYGIADDVDEEVIEDTNDDSTEPADSIIAKEASEQMPQTDK